MNTLRQPEHPGRAEQTTKNIALAFRLLEEAIDDPSVLDDVPAGSTVVVLPEDDPGLAMLNLTTAERLAARGESVHLVRVGVPKTTEPDGRQAEHKTLNVKPLQPRWATNPSPTEADLILTYDRASDVLLVDLFGGRRSGVEAPLNPYVTLLVDLDTQEIVGQMVPRFLEQAVAKSPGALDLLLFSNVRLVGISREEVRAMRAAILAGAPAAPVSPGSLAAIAAQLERLTA